jgi:hypothetical protein
MVYGFDDNKEKVEVPTKSEFDTKSSQVDGQISQANSNITALQASGWHYAGYIESYGSESYSPITIDFSNHEASIMLIATMSNNDNFSNTLFICCKTQSADSYAKLLGCAEKTVNQDNLNEAPLTVKVENWGTSKKAVVRTTIGSQGASVLYQILL